MSFIVLRFWVNWIFFVGFIIVNDWFKEVVIGCGLLNWCVLSELFFLNRIVLVLVYFSLRMRKIKI